MPLYVTFIIHLDLVLTRSFVVYVSYTQDIPCECDNVCFNAHTIILLSDGRETMTDCSIIKLA